MKRATVTNSTEQSPTQPETIYDHPLYYDILFGWDRTQEADFYAAAFHRFGVDKREDVLEVACGTGQVARVLAQRGWKLTGLDSREPMLAFLRGQASKRGLTVRTHCADMVDFSCDGRFGAAVNPLSSLLLVHSDALAEAHFAAIAAALRAGGVYVLDLDFDAVVPSEAQTTGEIWEESRGNLTVRAENDAVYVDDAGTHRVLPWATGSHLRCVTSGWLEDRVDSAGQFTIESWHPESGRTAAGVSQWSLDVRGDPPVFGRAIVVLRRR
jgi:SAM-dependent methyltransferase